MIFLSRSEEIFHEGALLLLVRVSLSFDLKLSMILLLVEGLFASIINWNLSALVSRVESLLAWSQGESLVELRGEDLDFFLWEEGKSIVEVRLYEIWKFLF